MATRKSPTTAKKPAKTTKRPAKTAAAKTRTSRAVSKPSTKLQTQKLMTLTLDKIWLTAAILFLGLAVAAALLMDRTSYLVTQTHLTRDVLLSQQGTAFISAAKPVWDMELRWTVSLLMALSAIGPVLYLTRLKAWYANRVSSRRLMESRWLDLGISSAIMIEAIALMVGYTDLATLKVLAGLMVVTCGLGWLAERQNEKTRRPEWSAFGLSVITGVLPWLVIGSAHVATLLFGEVRSPWYVYAACITTLVGFSLLALNQWNQHRRYRAWADYAVAERNYALIMTATKIAFAGILIAGLLK